MLWCLCGQPIVNELGHDFVVTIEDTKKWLRRRSDAITCALCGQRYDLGGLQALVRAEKAS